MNILLDTHALVWWFNEPERLSKRARNVLIDSQSNSVWVSAASAWELAIKANLGKFKPLQFVMELPNRLLEENFIELAVAIEHSVRAGLLPSHHNDPFDRLLVAQAQSMKAVIISADKVLDRYDIKRIW